MQDSFKGTFGDIKLFFYDIIHFLHSINKKKFPYISEFSCTATYNLHRYSVCETTWCHALMFSADDVYFYCEKTVKDIFIGNRGRNVKKI